MKKIVFLLLITFVCLAEATAQIEYKVITSIESIVPNGLGRSRLISTSDERDYQEFTSTRSEDKDEDSRNKSDRSEIRVKNFEETKLLNFYKIGRASCRERV